MLTDIVDKVVWVTGASSGIGAAAAIALSQAGAKVILSGRREAKLRAISENLKHETLVAPLDVSIAEDVTQVVAQDHAHDTAGLTYSFIAPDSTSQIALGRSYQLRTGRK